MVTIEVALCSTMYAIAITAFWSSWYAGLVAVTLTTATATTIGLMLREAT